MKENGKKNVCRSRICQQSIHSGVQYLSHTCAQPSYAMVIGAVTQISTQTIKFKDPNEIPNEFISSYVDTIVYSKLDETRDQNLSHLKAHCLFHILIACF